MVYEGKRGRSAYGRRSAKNKKKKKSWGRKVFSACLIILFVAVAASLAWPEAAAKVRSKAASLIGSPDLGGAVEVFGQTMGSGGGIVNAFKDAWAYAFGTDDGGKIPVSGENGGDIPANADGGQTSPVMEEMPDGAAENAPGPAETDEPADPVEAFKASQAEYEQLGLPENVTFEKPEIGVALVSPVEGTVTSGFGYREHPSDGGVRFHYGLDIGAAEGSEVHAAAAGQVTAVGDSTSYGRYVILRHDDGSESLYAHLGETTVSGGSAVEAGDVIGSVGSSGNATSACLHLELIVDGNYVNPSYYFDL